MRTLIIIPAYNEEKRIGNTLDKYGSFFERIRKTNKNFEYVLLVVVNGTTDKTEDTIKISRKNNKRIEYIVLEKGGKGYAIIEGMKLALNKNTDFIGFVDADMATTPDAFYDLIKKIGKNGGAIASRWMPESIIIKRPGFVGRLKSTVFNFLVRSLFLFPYRDTQCGAKLMTKEAAGKIVGELGITKWAFDIDMIYRLRRKGFSVVEVPTTWEDRAGTKIKLMRASLEMFLAVIRLRIINSPLSFVVRAYDTLPGKLKIHHRVWKI